MIIIITHRTVLEEVFYRADLDGNAAISQMEFDFFQERTTGELCDEDSWQAIRGEVTTHWKSFTVSSLLMVKILFGYPQRCRLNA